MTNHTPRSSAEPAAATSSGSNSGPPSWALNEARPRGQPGAAHRAAAGVSSAAPGPSAPGEGLAHHGGGFSLQAWAAPAA
eukprot:11484912-Heterocapsa_arctica.AAC.1